jgi:hypothetical protein
MAEDALVERAYPAHKNYPSPVGDLAIKIKIFTSYNPQKGFKVDRHTGCVSS